MKRKRPVIQIGPITDDPTESVSAVNKSLIQGLVNDYDFVPVLANRTYGMTQQAMLNGINGLYFIKHLAFWMFHSAGTRPDIAHYAISSGWAMEKGLVFLGMARAFGAKTIGHLHSGNFIDHWNALPAWRRNWARRQLLKLDAMIVLSESWRDALIKQVGLPSEMLFVVNNPIDPAFEKAALQMPIERAETIILSLGVMGRDKGVMEALEAASTARPRVKFQLKLVGPERQPNIHQTVQQFISQHSLADVVGMKSSVWGKEKIEMFKDAGIFLLPSYYENFPLVVLEAAAAGQAIITTPVGATPEFFKDGVSAVFVEPRNSEQIARAIVRLVDNPEERYRLGRAAREVFVTRLARTKIVASLETVYRTVLSDLKTAAPDGQNVSALPANGVPPSIAAASDALPTTTYFTAEAERFHLLYQKKLCFQDRLNLFVEAVQRTTPAPAKILDFGCGAGNIAIALGAAGYEVLGLDGASGMVETARANAARLNLDKVRFQQVNAEEFDGRFGNFDAIVCSSVVEYIEDDLGLLKNFIGALRPGGCLIFSVPHSVSLFGKAEDVMRLSGSYLRREGSRHLSFTSRRYQRNKLFSEIEKMGFKVSKSTTFEFPLFGQLGIKLSRWPLIGRMMLVEGRRNAAGNVNPAPVDAGSRRSLNRPVGG
jgi:glycosyltransferase involved in cell wall biosynthesis/2-polyprenyl-3-methyl-5-hydroxy-6-metoxy-1,4-benzoquinol methylase